MHATPGHILHLYSFTIPDVKTIILPFPGTPPPPLAEPSEVFEHGATRDNRPGIEQGLKEWTKMIQGVQLPDNAVHSRSS